MRFLCPRRSPLLRKLCFAFAFLACALECTPEARAATVTGAAQTTVAFTQTIASGFLAGQQQALTTTLRTIFGTSGTAADQVDGVYANTLTFVASTPQTIDLTALNDVYGNALTCARLRYLAVKVNWTTDNVPLTLSPGASNGWVGLMATGSSIYVFPSSAANNGYTVWSMPQTTGAASIDGTHKTLKLDPGSAAGTVTILIGMCSA